VETGQRRAGRHNSSFDCQAGADLGSAPVFSVLADGDDGKHAALGFIAAVAEKAGAATEGAGGLVVDVVGEEAGLFQDAAIG